MKQNSCDVTSVSHTCTLAHCGRAVGGLWWGTVSGDLVDRAGNLNLLNRCGSGEGGGCEAELLNCKGSPFARRAVPPEPLRWTIAEALWLHGAFWSGLCARLARRLLNPGCIIWSLSHGHALVFAGIVVNRLSSKLASPQHRTGQSGIIKILLSSLVRLWVSGTIKNKWRRLSFCL